MKNGAYVCYTLRKREVRSKVLKNTEGKKKIYIFDSTLRDGEQSPGFSMNLNEKLRMASQLEKLKVDTIEAGFAVISKDDFESVKSIADKIKDCQIASLARSLPADIDAAYEAVKKAADPLIHVFLATSDIHMKYKLKKTPEEVILQTGEAVRYAKKYCSNVEFSAEDATRSDPTFLLKVFKAAIDAGATVINVPDTVGYAYPAQMTELITYLKNGLDLSHTLVSVHCHNDLGLATANSLAAVAAGADRVECTVNGIGERAGNAALEEIVMNLFTRSDYYNAYTDVDTQNIYNSSKMLTILTGVKVQPNKAIVGKNAFAHEAGIHQHGMLENRNTYEIMTPESVGRIQAEIVLGKHSGKHALEAKIKELGYAPDDGQMIVLFERFKKLADRKKSISDEDIDALARSIFSRHSSDMAYRLIDYRLNSGNIVGNTCQVRLKKFSSETVTGIALGDGPIDAAFSAINNAVKEDFTLLNYSIEAVTGGTDAQGAASVKISFKDSSFKGYGVSMNIFEASIYAYINAINNALAAKPEEGEERNDER